jgi:diphosphomevalonate decarboxylase
MISARPGLIYWNAGTLETIETVKRLRQQGYEAYFTIDAGPQVKILCRNETEPVVLDALKECSHVVETISTGPGPAAYIKDSQK